MLFVLRSHHQILSILLVSRQSFFHKYMHLSGERAARYHVWTGNFGVLALLLHGILYTLYWVQHGELRAKLFPCTDCSAIESYKTVRNFSGLVALVLLLVVALGSVEWMRRRHFRHFSLVHCLNVLFVLFTVIHYYPATFWLVPGVLVYVLYRVVALFGQGKSTVISSASLADKVVQLELRRDPGAGDFHPGQYVYIKVDEIGHNEWHPFTISSSPLKNRYAFHLDAKVQGRFTRELLEMIKSHRLATVKVDGYYGSAIQSCAHMVFVAGGSGMTPFLSFLEHLQLRSETMDPSSPSLASSSSEDIDEDKAFPKTVWIIWTCRDIELLEAYAELLQSVKKSSRWKTKIWLHLTASADNEEDEERLELRDASSSPSSGHGRVEKFFPSSMHRHAYARDSHLTPLVTFLGTSCGMALCMYLVYTDKAIGDVWWLKRTLLLLACVFGAAFGGALVLITRRVILKKANEDKDGGMGSAMTELEFTGLDMASPVAPQTPRKFPTSATSALSRYFSVALLRPDLRQLMRGIHSEIQENFGMSADVGLFMSGPATLQADVLHHARGFHSPLLAVHQKSFTV